MVASSARGQLFGSPPSRDVEKGEQVARLVEQHIGLYSLPEAETWLRKIGDRLVTLSTIRVGSSAFRPWTRRSQMSSPFQAGASRSPAGCWRSSIIGNLYTLPG